MDNGGVRVDCIRITNLYTKWLLSLVNHKKRANTLKEDYIVEYRFIDFLNVILIIYYIVYIIINK